MRNTGSFPSSNTTVGLGRSFSWNQWARVKEVVDGDFRVRRDKRAAFLAMAESLRSADNALDARGGADLASTQAPPSAGHLHSISLALLA